MPKILNSKELNRMALEVIALLKKWGLWRDTMII